VRKENGEPVGLWTQLFPEGHSGWMAPMWTVWITSNGSYELTSFIDIGYATSAPNHIEPDNWVTWLLLEWVAVGIDRDGLHCNQATPTV
jgi:hypothetical protein